MDEPDFKVTVGIKSSTIDANMIVDDDHDVVKCCVICCLKREPVVDVVAVENIVQIEQSTNL